MRDRDGVSAAQVALKSVGRRIRGYAGSDPELRGLVAELERDLPEFAGAIPEMSRKQHHFASANLARTRDVYGRSVRGRRRVAPVSGASGLRTTGRPLRPR